MGLLYMKMSIGYVILSMLALTAAAAAETTQDDLDYLARYLTIRYEVFDNWIYGTHSHVVHLTLTNTGSEIIQNGDWAIYFSNIRIIRPFPTDPNPADLPESAGMTITHLIGSHHELAPLKNFTDIPPGENLQVPFTARYYTVARSDIMPNWYVAAAKGSHLAGQLIPRTIANTADESLSFVAPFLQPKQWKRYNNATPEQNNEDLYHPYSPSDRYDKHHVEDLGAEKVKHVVIPTPQNMTFGSGYVHLGTRDWVIVVTPDSEALHATAMYISELTKMPIVRGKPSSRFIQLSHGNNSAMPWTNAESYRLDVNPDHEYVLITATAKEGAFYAFQTLCQLADDKWHVPVVSIEDSPRFPNRVFKIDVALNFQSKETVMLLLDAMARYKLNKLKFHLSDDEGWRLEIPDLPELTKVGARRCHDLGERTCLMPQLGSGPTDQTSGSGYYTGDEYREILQYAAQRHIEVIPDFDTSGHAHSQIKAMRSRFLDLDSLGDASASDYLLHDADDKSNYLSPQWFFANIMNPCLDSTYRFIDTIVRTLQNLHRNINPLKTIQLFGNHGRYGSVDKSPKCEQFKSAHKDINSTDELEKYYTKRVIEIIESYNLSTASGQSYVMHDMGHKGNSPPFDKQEISEQDIYVYPWINVWNWEGGFHAYALANAGYKVIMSQATHLLFDFPYEPDPEERGYHWSTRFIDTRRVFSFMPDNLYANADVSPNGYPITEEVVCRENNVNCPPLTSPENIVGIQAIMVSEISRNHKQLEENIFPKLLALAERAWHKAAWEDMKNESQRNQEQLHDWTTFANALGYNEFAQLDKMGIHYYVPPPGAKISSDQLIVTTAFPGLQVEYSPDDGNTWYTDLKREKQAGQLLLRTRSADGSRTSRIVSMSVTASPEQVLPNPDAVPLQPPCVVQPPCDVPNQPPCNSQMFPIPGIVLTITAFIMAFITIHAT